MDLFHGLDWHILSLDSFKCHIEGLGLIFEHCRRQVPTGAVRSLAVLEIECIQDLLLKFQGSVTVSLDACLVVLGRSCLIAVNRRLRWGSCVNIWCRRRLGSRGCVHLGRIAHLDCPSLGQGLVWKASTLNATAAVHETGVQVVVHQVDQLG